MTSQNSSSERRKHNRYRLRSYIFASLYPQSHVLGRVVDISMEGLAFCYPAREKQTDETSRLTISWGESESHIGGLPFEIIWDDVLPENASFGAMMRHCGVRFVDLTDDQKTALEYLIRDFPEFDNPL